MIKFKKIENEDDEVTFITYAVRCEKYHQRYANKLGLFDEEVANYNAEALKRDYYNKKEYNMYLIQNNGENVGSIVYKTLTSDIDNKDVIFIENIFVDPKYRGQGIAKKTILELKKKTKKRIELECWYEQPANNLYESLGMSVINTRYML